MLKWKLFNKLFVGEITKTLIKTLLKVHFPSVCSGWEPLWFLFQGVITGIKYLCSIIISGIVHHSSSFFSRRIFVQYFYIAGKTCNHFFGEGGILVLIDVRVILCAKCSLIVYTVTLLTALLNAKDKVLLRETIKANLI